MYDLTDFQSYQDYWKQMAEAHVSLGDKSFIFGDADVAVNEGRVWKGKKLWLEPYQPVTITDQLSDNYLQEKKGSLWVGGSAGSTKFQDEFDYFKECEIIVKDLISRALRDRNEEKLITRLTSYKFGMGEFMFAATKMIGCRLDFIYHDPTGFEYIDAKWND